LLSNKRSLDTLAIAVVAAIVIALDQYTKHLIQANAAKDAGYYSHQVIPHLLNWTYEQNNRGAFGMFGSNGALLIAMALVVLVIFWMGFRDAAHKSRLVRVAFGMIVGGAIGNIVDRIHLHYVVDFIDFYRIWPNIFNVADTCITSGVILLILSSLVTRRRA
jgi:signal peptidase II